MTDLRRDRFNQWWYTVKRVRIPKARARWVAFYPEMYGPVAWALITWSAWGWNRRAWAASIGCYLMVSIIVQATTSYLTTKASALKKRND